MRNECKFHSVIRNSHAMSYKPLVFGVCGVRCACICNDSFNNFMITIARIGPKAIPYYISLLHITSSKCATGKLLLSLLWFNMCAVHTRSHLLRFQLIQTPNIKHFTDERIEVNVILNQICINYRTNGIKL